MEANVESREWRLVASVALLLVACVALVGSVAATWVDRVLLDTDTFVAAIEPLARDEGVRALVSERVSSEIIVRADLETRLGALLPGVLAPLGERLVSEFERYVTESVEGVVHSDRFGSIWLDAARIWHGSFAEFVRGGSDVFLDFEGGAMRIALAPYLEVVEERLDEPLLAPVIGLVLGPARDARITLVESPALEQQVELVRWLYRMREALWAIAALAFVAGIALAPDRPLAVAGAGFGMLLGGVAPTVWFVAQRVTAERIFGRLVGATPDSSRAAYDALAVPAREWFLVVAGAGLVVAGTGVLLARLRANRSASEA